MAAWDQKLIVQDHFGGGENETHFASPQVGRKQRQATELQGNKGQRTNQRKLGRKKRMSNRASY